MLKKIAAPSFLLLFSFFTSHAQQLTVAGLQDKVEVYRDPWGINHIYAENEHDLFFTQGYMAAKDRLFQFEIWRRQATGTVAELLGEREIKRDIGTRLFKFRGNMKAEMNHYHERGEEIITAFVDGVNAYIAEANAAPEKLPIEFQLLKTKPQPWTPEVVISRHQGLLGNIGNELKAARAVAAIGAEKFKEIEYYHPFDPDLNMDPVIDQSLLTEDILELYNAYRKSVKFQPSDVQASAREGMEKYSELAAKWEDDFALDRQELRNAVGSNNWVVSGERTQSGYPMLANDPHRSLAAPSLRYWSHLVAPGWNVIGAGEPEIPGISIGHNEYGAWGLTVFTNDSEDLYVYETNPENPNQYKYNGGWEDMKIITETIKVKDRPDVTVELKYTRHGPVVFEKADKHVAYAVRCGWQEVGGAPYLASLRMDQAETWEEFREACNYSHIPGENMIWADRKGNIGWQAVGIAPIRKNFSGMVPVPGDGRYEWDGYLPIKAKPHSYNPVEGYVITANENLTKTDYEFPEIITFDWGDGYRGDRLKEIIASGRVLSLGDMAAMQTDYLALPAREIVPMLKNLSIADTKTNAARGKLLAWDFVLDKNSTTAAIYAAWEKEINTRMKDLMIPAEARAHISGLSMFKVIGWLQAPPPVFGSDPVKGRDDLLTSSLSTAIAQLEQKLGKDQNKWQYGQEKNHHVVIKHPMSEAVSAEVRKKLDVGPAPRGGYHLTPGVTGSGDNQTHGATFRIIMDTQSWDRSMGINSPGQSGDPDSKYYKNLFDLWANDKYFPVYYSKEMIMKVAEESYKISPR
ncbi:MAG: penicillin acylase family protein [Imperialibacter sp.]|uniref:penicillin acylase family protein n=1 Tax=Imperialibacter sp. TaxID=2038411 RepID=UPI0032F052F0